MNRKLKNEELNRLDPESFKRADKIPLIIVLDNVRSLHNVGAIFRTGDAFTVERIVLCGITARPPHREITKTAIGAEETVEWSYFEKTEEAVRELRSSEVRVIAAEQAENSISPSEFDPGSGKTALVLGNEVFGVQQSVIDLCDGVIEIPQSGTKHSLNIAVSAGILIWEMYKRYRVN